jgi:hypothetical protein
MRSRCQRSKVAGWTKHRPWRRRGSSRTRPASTARSAGCSARPADLASEYRTGRRSLTFGFEELGLDRIIARYDPENVASGKVMEKLGMNHVCDMPRGNAEGLARIYEIRAKMPEGDFEPSDP